ncbi:MAG: nicotinate (nicotinamide) nucleotide adenylyltransferase [Peptococcaceae bacterium]|nr:nicotinate (nicotinamide) nucleotide adenylyltransferase [Peptococcaceae bacterium]
MKIGLFGGTFDPIHLGHVDMAAQVQSALGLDQVQFLPAYVPPHKTDHAITTFADRLAMVHLALDGAQGFVANDIERTFSQPSYTVNTLDYLSRQYPAENFYYIMGADAFNSIESWHEWRKLLTLANFVVVDRSANFFQIAPAVRAVLDASAFALHHLPLKTLPISSSLVRARLRAGKSVEGLLSDAVADYICKNHLYGR